MGNLLSKKHKNKSSKHNNFNDSLHLSDSLPLSNSLHLNDALPLSESLPLSKSINHSLPLSDSLPLNDSLPLSESINHIKMNQFVKQLNPNFILNEQFLLKSFGTNFEFSFMKDNTIKMVNINKTFYYYGDLVVILKETYFNDDTYNLVLQGKTYSNIDIFSSIPCKIVIKQIDDTMLTDAGKNLNITGNIIIYTKSNPYTESLILESNYAFSSINSIE